jgi:hypothetical protein
MNFCSDLELDKQIVCPARISTQTVDGLFAVFDFFHWAPFFSE